MSRRVPDGGRYRSRPSSAVSWTSVEYLRGLRVDAVVADVEGQAVAREQAWAFQVQAVGTAEAQRETEARDELGRRNLRSVEPDRDRGIGPPPRLAVRARRVRVDVQEDERAMEGAAVADGVAGFGRNPVERKLGGWCRAPVVLEPDAEGQRVGEAEMRFATAQDPATWRKRSGRGRASRPTSALS